MADKSFAAQALENIEAAILKLTSGTNDRVNINGQEFTKKDLGKLMDQRARLKAEVIAESGSLAGGCITTTFRCI